MKLITFAYSKGVSTKALHVPDTMPPSITLVSRPLVPGIWVFPNLLSKIVYLQELANWINVLIQKKKF